MMKRINKNIVVVMMSSFLLTACGSDGGGSESIIQKVNVNNVIARNSIRFIAMGDGGKSGAEQDAIAKAIKTICDQRECDFAVSAGDNFYDTGVTSATDALFNSYFEVPYRNLNFPFYMALGNHDNTAAGPQGTLGGGDSQNKGDFQVGYHYRTDRMSNKWQMPERYYRQAFYVQNNVNTPLIEFFVLDSSPITATTPDPNADYAYSSYGIAQQNWAKAAVRNSQATWKFAMAHHPYASNGQHGNAGNFEGVPACAGATPALEGSGVAPTSCGATWKVLLEESICGRVDLFFQGHDHHVEWLKAITDNGGTSYSNPNGCGKTEFVLSGAAAKLREVTEDPTGTYFQAGQTLGFFWFEIQGNQATGTMYTVDSAGVPTARGVRSFTRQADQTVLFP